jgi:hypothetical protein
MKNLLCASIGVTLACTGLLLVSGCNNQAPSDPKTSLSADKAGPPPANPNDAMSNPNVPDSVKSQLKSMQGQQGAPRGDRR